MAYSIVKTFLALALLAVVACAPIADNTNATNFTFSNLTGEPVETETPVTPEEPVDQEFSSRLTFTEGDRIALKTLATDPDNDNVELSFTEPFDNNGVWQTEIGDAGDYPVTVTATDSKGAAITTRILVSIAYANRAPSLDCPDSVEVAEGEIVTIDCTANDVDGDETIMSFSGWMQSSTYQTTNDDAGEHTVTVSAEDGTVRTAKDITVTVGDVNRAPVISLPATAFETTELQEVRVAATAEDPDGDAVTITYGKPLRQDGTWTPALDQDGQYDVEITATDGTETTVETVSLTVRRTNRAPSLSIPSDDGFIHVKEGDLIDLRTLVEITDPEGEEVIATYAGWMNGPTYQSGYEDAGKHVVSITATDDSDHAVTIDVTIIVDDVNRPPVFVRPA